MNGNLKIGFLCSSISLGGLEMNLVKIAHWLNREGYNTILLGIKGSPLIKMAEDLKVPTSYIGKHWKYYDFYSASSLRKILKSLNINVVLIRDTRDMSLLVTTKFLMKGKLKIVYLQAMQLGMKKKDLLHTYRFNQFDAWICTLESMKTHVKVATNIDHSRLFVLPLALEINKFTNNSINPSLARKFFNIDHDGFLIGIIGRLDVQKGQHLILEAASQLLEKGMDIEVLIVGNPTLNEGDNYREKLERIANTGSLAGKVHFRPFNTKSENFYRAVDVFVMASENETFGIVTVESMASGTPVVGSASGGTIELLKHGELGLLFKPNDAGDLARNLELLYKNEELRKVLSEKGKQEATQNHSHDNFIYRLLKIINGDD